MFFEVGWARSGTLRGVRDGEGEKRAREQLMVRRRLPVEISSVSCPCQAKVELATRSLPKLVRPGLEC